MKTRKKEPVTYDELMQRITPVYHLLRVGGSLSSIKKLRASLNKLVDIVNECHPELKEDSGPQSDFVLVPKAQKAYRRFKRAYTWNRLLYTSSYEKI